MLHIPKPQINSKWDRINTIYELLNISHNGMSIAELSYKMGVSSKTIQRDLYEVLGEYGAIKNGRMWKLDKKQANDHLSSNERIILGILDEMAKNSGSSFYGKAHALLKQVSQQLEHPIFAHVESEILEEKDINLFGKLEEVIKSKKCVSFEYKKHRFEVKPLKLAFFDGFWYLLALDIDNSDKFKKFHLKSISSIVNENNSFVLPNDLEENLKKANSIWFDLDKKPINVHLLIDKEVMIYFERKPLRGQTILGKDIDGSTEIMISITHEMEILPLIFLYVPHIRVLEPQSLADIVKNKTHKYLQSL